MHIVLRLLEKQRRGKLGGDMDKKALNTERQNKN